MMSQSCPTQRRQQLAAWLQCIDDLEVQAIHPLAGDASFRRYYRVQTPTQTWVAMDAPPPQENGAPFIAIANALREFSLATPAIRAADVEQGFLLLTDFGDDTYLRSLTPENAAQLYEHALDALVIIRHCKQVPDCVLPFFNREWMTQEWSWHKEWFLKQLLQIEDADVPLAVEHAYQLLIESALNQPQGFMHRDYHSANLMVLSPDHYLIPVGILDFQDAFIGPLTYDVASLLRDCYIHWPVEQVRRWALMYREKLLSLQMIEPVAEEMFLKWFDWMGLQRHLKAVFNFARKKVRDHDAHYLAHIPRTLNYILQVSAQYTELTALHDYYQQINELFHTKVVACAR